MRLRPGSLGAKAERRDNSHDHLRRISRSPFEAHHIVELLGAPHHLHCDGGSSPCRLREELSAVGHALFLIVEDCALPENQPIVRDPQFGVPLVEVCSPIQVHLAIARALPARIPPWAGIDGTHNDALL